MARVNFDAVARRDPRFKELRLETGLPTPYVYGACLLVWAECYENRSPVLTKQAVDAEAEMKGFAEHMIKCRLASDCGDGKVFIHGVEERIRYLTAQRARSEKAVEAKKAKHQSDNQAVNQTVDPTVNQTVRIEPSGQPNGQPSGEPLGEPSDLSISSSQNTHTTRAIDLRREALRGPWDSRRAARQRAADAIGDRSPGDGFIEPVGPVAMDLKARLDEMLSGGLGYAEAAKRLEHAVTIAEAKAVRDRNLVHFATLWTGEDWKRATETTAEAEALKIPSKLAQGEAMRRRTEALEPARNSNRPPEPYREKPRRIG